ncbi:MULTISPECIES: O-methyltransferase [unclassified Paenibacillus]|uniref:O-methyltransferase n=1 Tax=unclassified Paenibacillus TaxID=185978 RepID=UPI001C1173E5|nr:MULTISPECIES: O-methyltransferase [unclassified Paenibacillus]MBU5443702.1 O-methyltransferase [Paenibacillus sp. MSJ-34]CAH0117636.1 Catechol O-methyltransferase [Paenibacillus sp. CECT 9249]
MTVEEQYMDALYPEDPVLERVKANIRELGMPEISVAPNYGRLLTLLVNLSGARQVLEIGALGGYSGICLARGLAEGGSLVSLELEEGYAAVAKRHLTEAGFGDRVSYRIGEALDSLAQLEREGAKFDFFFIDADKENYPNYLEWAIRLANPGAVIAADNTLLRGRTVNPDKNGPSVLAVRRFNEQIAQDERLQSAMLPAYDGLALAMVK